jgi:hypothetical protein
LLKIVVVVAHDAAPAGSGHVLAYNLTRVMNIMGIRPLMAAMRA